MARSSNNSSFSPSWNFQWKKDLQFANPTAQIYILFYGLGSWRHDDLAAVKHCQRYHYESSDKPSIMDFSPRSCRMCPCHLRPIFQMVDFFSLCHSATNWPTNGFLTATTWVLPHEGLLAMQNLMTWTFHRLRVPSVLWGLHNSTPVAELGVTGEELLNVLPGACLCVCKGDYLTIHKLKIPQEYLWWLVMIYHKSCDFTRLVVNHHKSCDATRHPHKFGRNLCRQHVWI